MRKYIYKATLMVLLFSPMAGFGMQSTHANRFNIVNNFNHKLYFTTNAFSNRLSVPPALAVDSQGTAHVTLPVGSERYVHVSSAYQNIGPSRTPAINAFFGVKETQSGPAVHGYLDGRIAYSWHKNTIVFCTHKAYIKNNGCQLLKS